MSPPVPGPAPLPDSPVPPAPGRSPDVPEKPGRRPPPGPLPGPKPPAMEPGDVDDEPTTPSPEPLPVGRVPRGPPVLRCLRCGQKFSSSMDLEHHTSQGHKPSV